MSKLKAKIEQLKAEGLLEESLAEEIGLLADEDNSGLVNKNKELLGKNAKLKSSKTSSSEDDIAQYIEQIESLESKLNELTGSLSAKDREFVKLKKERDSFFDQSKSLALENARKSFEQKFGLGEADEAQSAYVASVVTYDEKTGKVQYGGLDNLEAFNESLGSNEARAKAIKRFQPAEPLASDAPNAKPGSIDSKNKEPTKLSAMTPKEAVMWVDQNMKANNG